MPRSDSPNTPVAGHDDSLEPSPAQLGDTLTLDPGEWTPLDEIGTQIYVYGDQPVDVAVQYAEVEAEVRQLRAEVAQLREQLATHQPDKKLTCVCTGTGWPHVPSSERCVPSAAEDGGEQA